MTVLQELKSLMKEKGISPETASRFIECSTQQVYRWLKGDNVPSYAYRNQLRKAIRRLRRLS